MPLKLYKPEQACNFLHSQPSAGLVTIMLVIDPTGPVPPYRQVADILRERIRTGKLPAGARITESDLTEEFEVARNTARHALAVLRDEGLVYTVPQRGSYVGQQDR